MEDGGISRGVIRPAPTHIRTITTSGHITTVPNINGQQVRNENGTPDTMSQLKAQQQRAEFGHDG
jgi:hypothetical protein